MLALAIIWIWQRQITADSAERIQNAQKREKEAQQREREQRDDKLEMMKIIQQNTQALTELTKAVERSTGDRR